MIESNFPWRLRYLMLRIVNTPLMVRLHSPLVKHRLATIRNSSSLLDFVYTYGLGLFKPAQVRSEIEQLLLIMKARNPRVIVEIGTSRGGTLLLFSRAASPDATIVSVDLPGGLFGGEYANQNLPLYKSFLKSNQRLESIRKNSHKEETLMEVKKALSNEQVDFLFVDGDHSYIGVKRDFEMYSPLVGQNGIVAFHDIVEHPPETGCEVTRFWEQVKCKYENQEIIENPKQGWAGIGILFMNPSIRHR